MVGPGLSPVWANVTVPGDTVDTTAWLAATASSGQIVMSGSTYEKTEPKWANFKGNTLDL